MNSTIEKINNIKFLNYFKFALDSSIFPLRKIIKKNIAKMHDRITSK